METQEFGILIATHGTLCNGYLNTLQLILDLPEGVIDCICFEEGESLEEFEATFQAYMMKHNEHPLMILLDLPGGTPANMSLRFLSPSHLCIAGFNLPFLLELVIAKMNGTSWQELNVKEMMDHALSSFICYNDIIKQEE